MTDYPTLKGENIERKVIIRSDNITFLLVVHENNDNANLYIGGKNKYCMYSQIIKAGSRLSSLVDISIGTLSTLKSHTECAINNILEHGDDTKKLVYIMTSYIAKEYPHIKGLKFTDASTIVCDNGKTISLAELNYMVYGKTWYQRRFNAYLTDNSNLLFKEADSKFQALKQGMDWQLFCSVADNPICNSEWEALYNSAKTWSEFFGPIYDTIKAKAFCNIFSPRWLSSFIEQYSDVHIFGLTYILPIQQESIEYTVEPYSSGGNKRRSTRRRGRRSQRAIPH